MELYHSAQGGKVPDSVFAHLGSMRTAAQRVPTKFLNGKQVLVYHDHLEVRDNYGHFLGDTDITDICKAFADYASNVVISGFDANIKNPLRVEDCWDDDPIGSGAMDLFQENKQLTEPQRDSLRQVFYPFSGTVYTEDVMFRISDKDLEKLIREWENNAIFRREFEKRRTRFLSLNEPEDIATQNETVWLALTMRLRKWATNNGFDSFVYANQSEGTGDDSYVTLRRGQLGVKPIERRHFVAESYLKDAPQKMLNCLWEACESPDNTLGVQDLIWGGRDPASFWQPNLR